jgi:U3 small nucleolar RNA-associated protein 18
MLLDYEILHQSEGLVGRHHRDRAIPLPSEKVRVQRVLDGNHSEPPSTGRITTMDFHKTSNCLVVGSEDKSLRIFRVDHVQNPVLLSLRFPDLLPRSLGFLKHRDEVLVSGRKPYFYSYNSETGQLQKLRGPLEETQSLSHLQVSTDGTRFCCLGSEGYVHIGESSTKLWTDKVKMNTKATSAAFLRDHILVTSGKDASVYLWDLRQTSHCLQRFQHDDGSETSSLAVFHPDEDSIYKQRGGYVLDEVFLSVGTASGVASIFQASDRPFNTSTTSKNFYSYFPHAIQTAQSQGLNEGWTQMKTILNLTTKISSQAFHPSGQLLAIASYEKKDQLKLIHLPSYTVYTNWPKEDTPLHNVEQLAFSPDGNSLAIGNKRGKVLIYQLPHFMEQKERKDLKHKRRMN